MAILALAAIPLMEIAADATRNTARLETRALALTVAENVLARTMAQPGPLEAGIETGRETQLGRELIWTLSVGPAAPGDVQPLSVSVQMGEDGAVLSTLQSFKAVPLPLPDLPETEQPDEDGDDADAKEFER